MNVSKKTPITGSSLVVACLLALPASAQITYIYTGLGDADVILDGSGFTAAADEVLEIGDAIDATGPFAATTTALKAPGIVNVNGTSSLQFLGGDNATRTQQLTVNFEDASTFLFDSGHRFRDGATVNYNSSAHSLNTGNSLVFQSGGSAVPTVNVNSGSVTIGGLNPGDKTGQLNLNGGSFLVTGTNYATGGDNFNINFTSTSSSFILLGAPDINAWDAYFADGMFQINGVDKAKTDFDVALIDGDLIVGQFGVVIPEPSALSLLGGVLALGFVLRRRRS